MSTVPLFRDYAAQWGALALPMKKPATIATMKSHLRLLVRDDALGAHPVSELSWPQVQTVFTRIGSSLAPKTLRNYWATLHLVLDQARKDGLLREVPTPNLPRVCKRPQPFFTLTQMRAILKDLPEPYSTFTWVLAETGARIGEVLGLRVRDVNLAAGTVTFVTDIYRGKDDSLKTNSAYRAISTSRILTERLRVHLASSSRTEYVFRTRSGTPWWPAEAQKPLTRSMVDLKIPEAGFHAWRRGNITTLSKVMHCPEDTIAARVGHVPMGITLGVYSQDLDGADREWAEKLGAALEGGACYPG